MAIDLIIDTDVALGVFHEGRPRDIDDGFAIVEALNSPDINLVGITTVFGNGPHDEVFRVANELVALKNSKTPVRPGAIAALPDPTQGHASMPPTNPAVDFLAEQLKLKPMAVAAIGPLTNIGLLAHHYPNAAANITQLIIVAGRSPGREFFIGETGPVQDFNFENDVRAAELALRTCPNVVLAGFELTSQVSITKADLQTIKAVGTPTAQYFYDNSLAWHDHWTQTFPTDPGFHPWDSAAISWLKHPEFFRAEQRRCQVHWQPSASGSEGESHSKAQLICTPNLDGPQHTYLYGFADTGSKSGAQASGAKAFVQDVVSTVY